MYMYMYMYMYMNMYMYMYMYIYIYIYSHQTLQCMLTSCDGVLGLGSGQDQQMDEGLMAGGVVTCDVAQA